MILIGRTFLNPEFSGLNFIVVNSPRPDLGEQGKAAFAAFDRRLSYQFSDPDATKVVPRFILKWPEEVAHIYTAEAALKSSFEKTNHALGNHYGIVFSRRKQSMWIKVPKWCKLSSEDDRGQIDELVFEEPPSDAENQPEWSELAVLAKDRRIHLSFLEGLHSEHPPSTQEPTSIWILSLSNLLMRQQAKLAPMSYHIDIKRLHLLGGLINQLLQ